MCHTTSLKSLGERNSLKLPGKSTSQLRGQPSKNACMTCPGRCVVSLVVLVPSHTLYVVPGRRLMAQIALGYVGMFVTGNPSGDHVEVTHVVTRRSLMALCAVGRIWRWVPKNRNRPVHGHMALSAIAPEEPIVPVLVAVACCTIEDGFKWRSACVGVRKLAPRLMMIDPRRQPLIRFVIWGRRFNLSNCS